MEQHEIRKRLKKELDKGRYEHTKGVMYTAGCMAMAYETSIEQAMLAGLLHDCAKCIPDDEKLQICEEHDIPINAIEYESPFLLHAKLGAYLAETVYEVKDPKILHAIKVHTTGAPDMSTLDKIIYIADYIEPGRNKAVAALEDRKAEDVKIIDIREISPVADYFVIADGTNQNQIQAMRDACEEALYKAGLKTKQIEGNSSSTWILMDYGDIIVHIFSKEDRLFYDLERIWRDGKIVDVADL